MQSLFAFKVRKESKSIDGRLKNRSFLFEETLYLIQLYQDRFAEHGFLDSSFLYFLIERLWNNSGANLARGPFGFLLPTKSNAIIVLESSTINYVLTIS